MSFPDSPNNQVETVFKACNFAVVPGQFYLTSAVVRLALSYDRPVVVPHYGCAPEMVGPAGIYYESDDPEGLATALTKAIAADFDNYKRLAEKQSEIFTWEKLATEYRRAYLYCKETLCPR